jgi:catechol 2,3-dioxygenase
MTDRIATPSLHHVTLKTTRLREMLAFYATTLGMEVIHAGPYGAWLTNDRANHRLALLIAPGLDEDPDKLSHTGLHHTAYEYASIDELLATYARLKGEGIVPHACLDHGMTMSFYYVDPDGNSLELQFDEFGDWAESKKFMRTETFAANPIGVSVDPELVLAARARGASVESIHARSFGGEFTPDAPLDLRLPDAADSQTTAAISGP